MTITRKKVVKTAEDIRTVETGEITRKVEANENSKVDEYPKTNIAQVLYIWYLIIFRKKSMSAFLNLSSKVNVIYPTFA